LRDNGYICNEGVMYYRTTKQRVRLPITPELENWVLQKIAEAKRVITGPIPAPLIHSPKCVRCSLAPVCLPDETRMLAQTTIEVDVSVGEKTGASATESENSKQVSGEAPRRLIAAWDDTRPLYLNTPGYRVGCKDEVLTVKEKDRVIEEVRMRMCRMWLCSATSKSRPRRFSHFANRKFPSLTFRWVAGFTGLLAVTR